MLKLCTVIFDDPERDTRVVAYADRYTGLVGRVVAGIAVGGAAFALAAHVLVGGGGAVLQAVARSASGPPRPAWRRIS